MAILRVYIAVLSSGVIEKYDRSLIFGEPRAIPIEEIIEFSFGLRVEYYQQSKDASLLGCTVFKDGKLIVYFPEEHRYGLVDVLAGTIVVDPRLTCEGREGRLRFTLAHELAHWLIHRGLYMDLQTAAAMTTDTKKSGYEVDKQVERQADALAAALLLPKQ